MNDLGFYIVQALTGLSSAAALFLVASGLSIIFGVTRVVNFAHGSFYMLGAYIAYTLVSVLGGAVGYWVAMLLAAVAVGLIGVIVELTILRRVYQAPELFQLVATFGVILVIQDLTLLIWGAEDLFGPSAPGLDSTVTILGTRLPEYDLALIAISPVVLAALWFTFYRTRWGILVRAATEDREMVGALGVNQSWLFTGTFFLGSMLAGLGGAAQLPKGGADLLMDFNILAAVFVVVVVGGMGSIPGAFLAAVLISELNAFGILLIPQSTLVLMFLVMAIVLIARPWGLLGKPEAPGQHGQAGPPEAPLRPAPPRLKWLIGGVLALLVLLPLFAEDFTLVLAIEIAIMALFAASLHFAMGPGGMVSFGHAAFFGGGAYAAALLVKYTEAPMEVALMFAPLMAGVLALIVGWFCVRLTGVYLAMLTLAFAQVAWSIVFQWGDVTGGDDGILGMWPSEWASERMAFYYLTVITCTGGILFIRHVLYSPFGYAMRACRDSTLRSQSIGINVQRQQWLAFAFSGALAGLAGGLYLYSKGSVFPDEMSIPRSFDALIMVLLGGVKTVFGPVVGAVSFTWLQDVISRVEYWRLTLGALIIVLVVVFPQGIAGSLRHWMGRAFGVRELT
jgi:branched-chain amino acid transport system permease protein